MNLRDLTHSMIYNVNILKEKSKLYKKYRLYKIKQYFKTFDFECIRIKNINNEVINSKTIIYNKKIRKEVEVFTKKLVTTLPEKCLINFYKNINDLKVLINRTFTKNFSNSLGYYNHHKNTIFLNENVDDTIYHELMHLSSNYLNNNQEYNCGFMFENKSSNIGYGLNEGYTEYQTNKIINTEPDSYIFETIVAKYLEKIVGEDKMQELYFNADLYGLYKELLKYSTKIQINNFLNRLDYYTTRGSLVSNYKEIDFTINQENAIVNYLINTYDNKLKTIYLEQSDEINKLRVTFVNELIAEYNEYYTEIYEPKNKSK